MARNMIYSDEIYAKVDKKNKQLLEDFILEYKSLGRKKGTIDQYTADIKGFYCWNYENNDNKFILKCKKKLFRNFFLDMQEGGSAPARINRQQCALRNMLEYACDEEDWGETYDYEVNQMRKIKGMQKETVREIIFLSEDQIQALLDRLIQTKQYQKALFVSLAYESGARRNEIYQVTKASMLDKSNKKTNEVTGKRGKKFKLRYYHQTEEIFDLYIEQRGEDDLESLWYTDEKQNDGTYVRKQVGYATLYQWVVACRKALEKVTGEYLLFNAHSFRHSCATNLKNGTHHILKTLNRDSLEIGEIKFLLHHSDVSTTEGYLPNQDDEEEDAIFGI